MFTIAHESRGNADPEITQWLLDRGADPNHTNHAGETPLLVIAKGSGDPKIAQVLIENGADLNPPHPEGKSLIEIARAAGKQDLIDLLEGYDVR